MFSLPLMIHALYDVLTSQTDHSSTSKGRPLMTPRRQHMIAALQRSGKSERTQQSSVREVRLLAQCSPTSPDRLSAQELQRSFLHRTNGDASPQPPCASATVACASSLSLSS